MKMDTILFYPSSHKTFIERIVQFEEELMQETELVKGECSHPPLNDDVSDEYFYDFFIIMILNMMFMTCINIMNHS